MQVPAKLTMFALSTAAVFGLAFGAGSLLDPIAPADRAVDLAATDGDTGEHGDMDLGGTATPPTASPAAAGALVPGLGVPGLAASDRGYALRLTDTTPGTGDAVEVAFTIESPDGGAVLNYRQTHDKDMHLIVVRRDLSRFQHLHPERDENGTWTVPVNLTDAGVYRVFADFAPAALTETLTLGADLFVPGEFTPDELPAPSTTWTGDGYEVALTGTPAAGAESELDFTVARSGAAVDDLEPYLGAFGHLVSLRSGDLAYLHTHPAEDASAGQRGGPDIRFGTTFPTAGLYRLYLNFSHAGTVRTAEFTVEVPVEAGVAVVEPESATSGHSGH